MFKGMEWLPYEEWLTKTGIIQFGKEMTEGTYCRGLQNSHKNLMALRDVQQFWRVWQCVGDTLPQTWLDSADVFLVLCLRFGLFVHFGVFTIYFHCFHSFAPF